MNEYQVWHDRGFPSSRVRHALGLSEPIFPDDYVHVANVQAESIEQVWELVSDKGSVGAWAEDWECWERNPGVEVLAAIARSTSAGDVVVSPDGEAYRVQAAGFDYVEASEDGKFRLQEILDVMARARA